MKPAKIIAVSNQKGGVGKTTTCINLASALGISGYKTLLIDFDPQANSTSGLGFTKNDDKNIYRAILQLQNTEKVIIPTKIENLDIVQSHLDLSGAELELTEMKDREFFLRTYVQAISSQYQYIIIDCPPSLGLLTLNALVAAKSILIPLQCEYFAMEGMTQLLITINLIREKLNKNLQIEGILPTMFDTRNNISHSVVEEAKKFFGEHLFQTIIPRNVRLSEAPSYGLPICLYDKSSKGAISYFNLAKELYQKHSKE